MKNQILVINLCGLSAFLERQFGRWYDLPFDCTCGFTITCIFMSNFSQGFLGKDIKMNIQCYHHSTPPDGYYMNWTDEFFS
jgi:hypothetical protein